MTPNVKEEAQDDDMQKRKKRRQIYKEISSSIRREAALKWPVSIT